MRKRNYTMLPYKCPYCRVCFARFDRLKRHTVRHRVKSKFAQHQRRLKHTNSRQNHLKYIKNEINNVKSKQRSLINEINPVKCETQPEGTLPVEVAPSVEDKNCLLNHVNCKCYGQTFKTHNISPTKLSIQIVTEVKPYHCMYCQKCFSQRSNLKVHLRTHTRERPFACSFCDKDFKDNTDLMEHIRTHFKDTSYQCTVCQKFFPCERNLARHLMTHNNHTPDFNGNFKFDTGFYFKYLDLESHIQILPTKKMYLCDYCKKYFSSSSNLTRHINVIHKNYKKHKCEYCSKLFGSNSDMVLHQRSHTKEKPYQCSYCQKWFARRNDLKVHIRTHTNEKPYQCTHCKECFAQKGSLISHTRIHTKEKPFHCPYCRKSFAHRFSLTQHVLTHTNENPYKCDWCDKAFTQSSNLKRHWKTHGIGILSQKNREIGAAA